MTTQEQPLIVLEHVSHSFGRGEAARVVLNNIAVDFYPGEIAIVMGPSGAGKTTMLTLVGALRLPQAGAVRVLGHDLFGAPAKRQLAVRRQIGFIFQHHNLIESLNAVENVRMGLEQERGLPAHEIRRRAVDMLNRVGLSDHLAKRPSELSGGQRQRVAIARALVREPAIILADEPTAALDSQSGREIVELLQKLAREQHAAILMVTHDTRILDIADRMLMLEDGRIEETHRALDRLLAQLGEVLRTVAAYPARSLREPGPEEMPPPDACSAQLETLRRQAALLASRRLSPPLQRKTAALADLAEQMHQIDEAVRAFCAYAAPMRRTPCAPSADRLFQTLEFLLMTFAEAVQSGTREEFDDLALLTTDRNELMQALRKQADVSDTFLALTDVFARAVYFMHAAAALWRELP